MDTSKVYPDYQKAKQKLQKNNLHKGFVAIGSSRIAYDDDHIKEIKEISKICAKYILNNNKQTSFITGGGPSVMTAWLEEPFNLGAQASALALDLPNEKEEDHMQFCNKEISYKFETFYVRKIMMLEYAKAIIVFEGGFGTMDELFEYLTLMYTDTVPKVPILIYPQKFYNNVLNFESFLKRGTIREKELNLLTFFNSKEELIEKLLKIC